MAEVEGEAYVARLADALLDREEVVHGVPATRAGAAVPCASSSLSAFTSSCSSWSCSTRISVCVRDLSLEDGRGEDVRRFRTDSRQCGDDLAEGLHVINRGAPVDIRRGGQIGRAVLLQALNRGVVAGASETRLDVELALRQVEAWPVGTAAIGSLLAG